MSSLFSTRMKKQSKTELISIIIPTYNEEKPVGSCLKSLQNQNYNPLEIIIVDDDSTDKTQQIVSSFQSSFSSFKLLRQDHQGPGPARNFGASKARGEILVFVDADMIFEKNFIRDLVKPILEAKTIGTFSKNEMVSNKDNLWSICWNINRNVPKDRMLPIDYPDQASVYRAILKKEFDKVGGFDTTGEYTDDWSLSRKLKIKSSLAAGAIYYHSNPSSLEEIFKQSRWIGKNEFISGSPVRRLRSLLFYSFPASLTIGIYKSIIYGQLMFVFFKLFYDLGIWISVVRSFFGEKKSK